MIYGTIFVLIIADLWCNVIDGEYININLMYQIRAFLLLPSSVMLNPTRWKTKYEYLALSNIKESHIAYFYRGNRTYCLSFFNLRLLITLLTSSNFSYSTLLVHFPNWRQNYLSLWKYIWINNFMISYNRLLLRYYLRFHMV